MYITEIKIIEFGGLKNKSIVLSSGLNLLTGENESGKSTICAFIKYVLYGFEKGEKERRENYITGTSAGYLTIKANDGKLYRIERSDGSGSSKSKVSVICGDGTAFSGWTEAGTPGEYFLGMSEKMYSRSLYVSQENGSAQDEKSAEAVSNLLLSGDEAINLHKAKTVLEKVRKELRFRKGRGGKICDSEDRLEALKERFGKELEINESVAEIDLKLREKNKERAELLAEKAKAERSESGKRIAKAAEIIKQKKQTEAEAIINKQKRAEVLRRYTANGFLPKSDYIALLNRLGAEYGSASEALELQKKSAAEAETKHQNAAPEGYEKYKAVGGKAEILAQYEKLDKFSERFNIGKIVTLIVAIASLCALLLGQNGVVGAKMYALPFLIISVVAFITTVALDLFWKKKMKEYGKLMGVPDGQDIKEYCRVCDEYEKAVTRDREFFAENIDNIESRMKDRVKTIEKLLRRWDKKTLSEAFTTYERYTSEKEKLDKEKERLLGETEVLKAYLSGYSEWEKEAAEKGEYDDTEVTGRSSKEIQQRTDEVNSEIQTLEVQRAEKTGGEMTGLEKLTIDIENEKRNLSAFGEIFEAVMLAIRTLEEAESGVRNTVSPYLGKVSGEYFGELTGGKYSELILSAGMELSYRTKENGMTVDSSFLSGGSADLAWYCLRLALHQKLSEEGPLPLILDECFVYLDDKRLTSVLEMLERKADKGTQILILSASGREKGILSASGKNNLLSL